MYSKNVAADFAKFAATTGGLYWTRTSDPIDVNDVLYQLSQQTGTLEKRLIIKTQRRRSVKNRSRILCKKTLLIHQEIQDIHSGIRLCLI